MKYIRMLAFVLIGLIGISASISIILTTIVHLLLSIFMGNYFMAIGFGGLWLLEMAILNYIVEDYHGE